MKNSPMIRLNRLYPRRSAGGTQHPLSFVHRLAWFFCTLVTAWVFVVLGLSEFYLQNLMYPNCSPSNSVPSGFQNIRLQDPEGLQIPAWWHPPLDKGVVVLMGGHASTRDSLLEEGKALTNAGFGVLLPSSGGCSGRAAALGILETLDLDASLTFLREQASGAPVGAMGFSAGGVAVLRGAEAYPEIQAIAAVGNYANLWGEIQGAHPAPLSLEWQFQRGVAALLWFHFGSYPPSISPIDTLPRLSPRPILLIHGEKEIARTRGLDQFKAAREPKSLWVVPGADHGEYLSVAREEYLTRVVEFFTQNLGNSRSLH